MENKGILVVRERNKRNKYSLEVVEYVVKFMKQMMRRIYVFKLAQKR